MDRVEALARLAEARVAHLATVRPDGRPHLVPITFAVVGGSIVTAVDHKPKSTGRLQRLINIEANSAVSVLVDHYEDEWERLWWVRVDGVASIHPHGESWQVAIHALVAKYPQYRTSPPDGPVVSITEDRVSSWTSDG